MKWRTLYNRPEESPGLEMKTPSLARQEFRDDCEISSIIERFKATGMTHDPSFITGKQRPMPFFADLSDLPDYQGALQIVQNAQEHFASLPASLRARFNNDPAQLLAFVANPQFRQEAQDLGLIEKSTGAGAVAPATAPNSANSAAAIGGNEGA